MKLYKSIIVYLFFALCVQHGPIMTYLDKSIDEEMCEAITKSDIKKVSDLLNKGANPNSKSIWGATNLGFAVSYNKIEIVELLLKKGANPNLKGGKGSSLPLIYAISNKNFEMVQLLLKYKADPSYDLDYDGSPIEYARGILGYPSRNCSCHPIVSLLLENIQKKDIEEE